MKQFVLSGAPYKRGDVFMRPRGRRREAVYWLAKDCCQRNMLYHLLSHYPYLLLQRLQRQVQSDRNRVRHCAKVITDSTSMWRCRHPGE